MSPSLPITDRKLVKRRDIELGWLCVWFGGGYLYDWTPADFGGAVRLRLGPLGLHFIKWRRPRKLSGRRWNLDLKAGKHTRRW